MRNLNGETDGQHVLARATCGRVSILLARHRSPRLPEASKNSEGP